MVGLSHRLVTRFLVILVETTEWGQEEALWQVWLGQPCAQGELAR